MYREGARMSQNFDVFVPSLKHSKLLACAEETALVNEKAKDAQDLKQATDEAIAYFEQYRFWWINDGEMIFDRDTGLLWQGKPDLSKKYEYYNQEKANNDLESLKIGGLTGWKLPSDAELKNILEQKEFPLQTGQNFNLFLNVDRLLTSNNYTCYLASSSLQFASYNGTSILAVLSLFKTKQDSQIILNNFIDRKWNIKPFDTQLTNSQRVTLWEIINNEGYSDVFHYDPSFLVKDLKKIRYFFGEYYNEWEEDLTWLNFFKRIKSIINQDANLELAQFHQNLEILISLPKKTYSKKSEVSISEVWQDLDYLTTRLPKIDALRFSDVDQGMWEFYVPDALKHKYQKISSEQFYRDRNPALDIQDANVAIDFGTSSTVVAIRQNGRDELLRIGMQAKDFHKDELTDQQYENPTILEFTDLQSFLKDWKSEAYRPLVNWDNIHCAHEARASLRNNGSNSHVVSSIFARLKQWALRDEKQAQVRIRDQKKHEYQLDALHELNPVKGQSIELNSNYPEIDPIEIYAWFLGMNINWRARGIFLNYYLTFPVEYPNDVKARILASFRRGLQRSLPESLIYDERFTEFSVDELASEPAAFAASALQRLEIEPVDGGVSYAVFDFGGGTTDFDYGFYRTPTDDEYDEGWDHVIEHFGSSGDKFLGGENLLENLAYLVFQANSSECRKKNISFTKPLDATAFAGSELLIAQTQAAYTNTTLMMSKLRPLWEKGELDLSSEGLEKFQLIDKNGELVDCNIEIKQVDLIAFLEQRIQSGLKEFFIALRKAFMEHAKKMPDVVHILLAGNSSRSRIVLGLLGRLEDERSQALHELLLSELAEIFGDEFPELEIHLPLDADPSNPYAATAKTGVALGLLRLCPGETLKVVNHATLANTDSPFQYFVGTFRRDQFQTAIQRGQNYDEWVELGRPLNGVFVMGYTTSSKAALENSLKRGEIVLSERSIRLSGHTQGQKVFAKVISSNQIEICTATSLSELQNDLSSNIQILDFK